MVLCIVCLVWMYINKDKDSGTPSWKIKSLDVKNNGNTYRRSAGLQQGRESFAVPVGVVG